MSQTLRVARYRFRATFARRWGGLLAIVLLIGLTGGLAMGAIAGARRTQSSFPAYLASTNPSDLLVVHNDSVTDLNVSDGSFLRTLSHLPHVKSIESVHGVSELLLGPDGTPAHDPASLLFNSSAQVVGNINGEFSNQDRPTVIQGRPADPKRADEMVMSADAAALLHLHVGSVVHFGFYTDAQTLENGYGTAEEKPRLQLGVKLVGIVKFHYEVIRDDTDRELRFVLLTPALTDPLTKCCTATPIAGVKVDGGSRYDTTVDSEITQHLQNSSVIKIVGIEEATAERGIEPQSIALGVFGAIAALAALLIAGQAIGRQLRAGSDELDALRALGAGPATILADGLIGMAASIVAGALRRRWS